MTNSLATRFPELAAELHPSKNGPVDARLIYCNTIDSYWWACAKGHEWETQVNYRTTGNMSGCPYCAGNKIAPEASLAARAPDLAAQWHPTKNGDVRPDQVGPKSEQVAWWKCPVADDHEWSTVIASRAGRPRLDNRAPSTKCPFCSGFKVSSTNALAIRHPLVAADWHPTRNGNLTASDFVSGSNARVWWKCPDVPNHAWQATIIDRTGRGHGCPGCRSGWTIAVIREFVRSLAPHLASLTPGELWVIFQQSGALDATGRGKAFIKALATGRFPENEIADFLAGEASAVDDYFGGADHEAAVDASGSAQNADDDTRDGSAHGADGGDDVVIGDPESLDDLTLPTLSVASALSALDAATSHSSDPEAIAFLIASAKAKLWRKVFSAEATAVAEARAFVGTGYADAVRIEFLREYEAARSFPIPTAYAFVPREGGGENPNLMQRLVASRIQREHRMGNWSGTGTGKTNAAILASRVVESKLTVVCCPNSVVGGWVDAITAMFPDSTVVCKTFEPDWRGAENHLYLVVNYEMFQQAGAEARVRAFARAERITFVVIDEIQFVKQRGEDVSRRRETVGTMLEVAVQHEPDLYVLGLSATPAINNLREPIALIEMITGKVHDDLASRPTVANCMRVYQRLTTLGPRWLMDHKSGCRQREIQVDCSMYVDEIRRLGRGGTPLELEEILTRARLPAILEALVPKTIVYTYYVGGADRLDRQLYDAITAAGWRTGFFTGDEKAGLDGFLNGDVDVLIASSAISTGVDRLQHVCNRLIINVLPWTAAEFEQLIGRIHRQGQKRDVEVIIPMTRADVMGQEWSWCRAKMQRLHFKKTVADAAVDGVVPEGHLRSQEKAYQDLIAWLERLSVGAISDVDRAPLAFASDDDDAALDPRRARFGEFSAINARWNRSASTKTHERLAGDPAEWHRYHDELARVRREWSADPQEAFLAWAQRRTGLVIGDFGCGRAKVRESLTGRHEVHSFDHVAAMDVVVACDMAHVPLPDSALDVALFCLSTMGSNVTDYFREAYRTMKLDGWLHVYEPTSRISNRNEFVRSIRALGFGNIEIIDVGAFTHVSARKTEHAPRSDVHLSGLG